MKFLLLNLFFMNAALAIINGEPVVNKSNSVLKIRMHWKESPDMPCTASVISRYSIITAAHCVDKIDLNSNIKIILNEKASYKVSSIYVPLGYYSAIDQYHNSTNYEDRLSHHRNTALFDIAIINLKRKLPKAFRPISLGFYIVKSMSEVSVFGKGLTQYDPQTGNYFGETNKLYKRTETLNTLSNKVYMTKGSSKIDFITGPGDSGGPLLHKNKIIAITRGSSSTPNEAASIYTPLWMHKDFIQKYMY